MNCLENRIYLCNSIEMKNSLIHGKYALYYMGKTFGPTDCKAVKLKYELEHSYFLFNCTFLLFKGN